MVYEHKDAVGKVLGGVSKALGWGKEKVQNSLDAHNAAKEKELKAIAEAVHKDQLDAIRAAHAEEICNLRAAHIMEVQKMREAHTMETDRLKNEISLLKDEIIKIQSMHRASLEQIKTFTSNILKQD